MRLCTFVRAATGHVFTVFETNSHASAMHTFKRAPLWPMVRRTLRAQYDWPCWSRRPSVMDEENDDEHRP